MTSTMSGHWSEIARRWAQVGPPLRPSEEDVAFYTGVMHSLRSPRALILGVTPELYRLPWPRGASVLAADHTCVMIDAVWLGPREAVMCADWRDLPLPDASRNLVMCDGGLHLLSYPHGQRKLAATLHRVIEPGGLFVLRLFVPPAVRESGDQVLDDLLAGRIPNLNVLKLRLGMALQENAHVGVALRLIHDVIARLAPSLNDLADRLGWPREHLLAVESYRDSRTRYHFVTMDDVIEMFCQSPGGFEVEKTHVPAAYERCPFVVLRRVRA
jgi:SAM-dependent methyltransferase